MERRIGNQEDKDPVYLRYPSGVKKALLIHIARPGGCLNCWERDTNNFTDGIKVYRRIPFDIDNK